MSEKEYIERGALLKRFEELHDGGNWLVNDYNADWIHSFIENAPAADVVEVRHGEWIDKPTGAYGRMQSWCSSCGKHSGIGGIESNRHKPYCPKCGAKMDGERKENP